MLNRTRHYKEEQPIVTTSVAASQDTALVQGVLREVAKRITANLGALSRYKVYPLYASSY